MPITVKAVSQADYDKWLTGAIEEFAGTPRSVAVASANMEKVQAVEAGN